MIKKYAKGYRAERSLVYELSKRGFMVIRTPHSGSISLASPDIIAASSGKLIVIECKSYEKAFKIKPKQINELKKWQDIAGATAYIAWKKNRMPWNFLPLNIVVKNNGNINMKLVSDFGISIEKI